MMPSDVDLQSVEQIGPAASGWAFPQAPIQPLIEVPHRVRPDLAKLGEAPCLLEDNEWSEWVREKRALLKNDRLVLVEPGLDCRESGRLVAAVRQFFQGVLGITGPIDATGRFTWLNNFLPRGDREFWSALSLSLQEDFAVMLNSDSRGLRSAILSVASPSGWIPSQRLGQSMSALHEPVADSAALQQSMQTMSQAMVEKGPFVRTVWTLAGSSSCARPPGLDDTIGLTHAAQLWFRHERQVTIPLGGGACLFLIRVMLAPYGAVVRSPGDHERLVASLESMSAATIAYKKLSHAMRLVLAC